MKHEKLSTPRQIGYGFGMLGESMAINAFLVYFMFFLTDVAMLKPGIAGTIITVGCIFGAFTDLTAGAKSDGSRNVKGKRRPFIFKAAILLGVATVFLYTDWAAIPDGSKPVYFLIVLMIYEAGLSFSDIPYQSLGSEITADSQERLRIRGYANVLNYLGMLLSTAGTMTMVVLFMNMGSSQTGAWSKVGMVFGAVILISYWISVFATRGREPVNETAAGEKTSQKEIFGSYAEVVKLKAYRPVLLYSIFAYAGLTLFTSMFIYYLTYNMGYTEGQTATVQTAYSLMVIVLSVIFANIRTDAKKIVLIMSLICGIVLSVFHFFQLNSVGIYLVFFVFSLAMAAFFVQVYGILYEVCDIAEYVSGTGRGGQVMSLFYFISKVMAGLSISGIGWILEIFGYDALALEQSASALNGISIGTLLLSGILFLVAAVAISRYPGNKARIAALQEALQLKRQGKEYSEDGFKELL